MRVRANRTLTSFFFVQELPCSPVDRDTFDASCMDFEKMMQFSRELRIYHHAEALFLIFDGTL